MKLDVWRRLWGVRYAIFQVDLARSLAATRPVGQREGPFALRVGRFFLFLGVGDLTRNLLGYKFVK